MTGLIGTVLMAKGMDAYIDWREECLRVNEAYAWWASTTAPHAAMALGAYSAALDPEERAANM